MKAYEVIKQHDSFEIGYMLSASFKAGYITKQFENEINSFHEQYPDLDLDIDSNGITLNGCEREQLYAFLKTFGGNWDKMVSVFYPDKMDYFRDYKPKEGEDGFAFSIKVIRVTPPPACQIIEEEVDVPARKEKRKRIVCPQTEQTTTETEETPV